MIYSMTAFAHAEHEIEGGRLQWELRSVNHRYLEPHFRLPERLRDLEMPLRETARQRLRRGKVDCTLKLEAGGQLQPLEVNRPALLQLLAAIEQIKRDAPEAGPPDPLELLRWPGILGEPAADTAALREAASEAFAEALDGLIAHRAREGAQLMRVIEAKLGDIETLVAEVRAITDGLAAEQLDKLKVRLNELEVNVDPARLEQEIALAVQRADVTEELDRLRVHVTEGRDMLHRDGPHGRQLDFLMQELNREANTLGSKSILAQTAQRAIDLKVTIEQIREQIQNIE